jgi:hypothetical protein
VLGNVKLDVTTSNIVNGSLYPYVASIASYHCPADRATVPGHAILSHTRSYSVEGWLGANFYYPDTGFLFSFEKRMKQKNKYKNNNQH